MPLGPKFGPNQSVPPNTNRDYLWAGEPQKLTEKHQARRVGICEPDLKIRSPKGGMGSTPIVRTSSKYWNIMTKLTFTVAA